MLRSTITSPTNTESARAATGSQSNTRTAVRYTHRTSTH